jgi:hypothetical protein
MRKPTVVAVVAGLVAALAALGSAGASAVDPAAAERAPTTTGLVLNYRFDNDSGVVAHDSSPNAIHGKYVNTTAAAARSAGVPGRSWAITLAGGKKQYVSVPERNDLDVDRFTVAALVRYTGVENDKAFGRWEVMEKAGAYWVNVRTDGKVRVGGYFGGCTSAAWKYLDSNVVVPTNTWTHVASTYNGSTLSVWINGARAGSLEVTGRTCSNNLPLSVGAKNYPAAGLLEAFWDGRLDDFRIYDRALSASEIRGLLPG